MINTYHTSHAPPPVPPRLNRSQPVLIPAPLPSQGHSKPVIRFLVGAMFVNLLLSVGGFIYLYYYGNMTQHSSTEGQVAHRLSEKQETFYNTLAHMVVEKSTQKSTSGYLQWDIKHSVLKNINYYKNSWLTIEQPGDYYIYSTVTFSKGDPKLPLASRVKLRKNEAGAEKVVMPAYCNLDGSSGSPQMCTATQGKVITLDRGNQLSVWVQDLSLVDYEEGATAFGMYKL
ncbi:Tumor necrosis factor ligand superfamily member 6 Apoptosis antigen ligand [Channa argus]|uniref:Tumor necrosis factor ligand superfamily member 6 Apoptosis antigen ligand n=1 Tax=Channa argus TaxID=215402 RepID=A0A6G1PUV3_CHAAH|nr:Tumor necrosis factor ligand superfamily member 6 Apoptosis antigen ligand [Channa argus]KAK2904316.1 hypothetical protein Q8A73_010973 [Channa argus]